MKNEKQVNGQPDWWEQISDKERKAIDQGLDQIEKGLVIPHKTVMKLIKEKLNL